MSFKTPFYCGNCEYQSYVEMTIDTEGFEVECPNCHCVWWFSAEADYDKLESAIKTATDFLTIDEFEAALI